MGPPCAPYAPCMRQPGTHRMSTVSGPNQCAPSAPLVRPCPKAGFRHLFAPNPFLLHPNHAFCTQTGVFAPKLYSFSTASTKLYRNCTVSVPFQPNCTETVQFQYSFNETVQKLYSSCTVSIQFQPNCTETVQLACTVLVYSLVETVQKLYSFWTVWLKHK